MVSSGLSGGVPRAWWKTFWGGVTASLRTKIMDFRGSDSSRILILRGGILRPIGNAPESLSQRILGIILKGSLGVSHRGALEDLKLWSTWFKQSVGACAKSTHSQLVRYCSTLRTDGTDETQCQGLYHVCVRSSGFLVMRVCYMVQASWRVCSVACLFGVRVRSFVERVWFVCCSIRSCLWCFALPTVRSLAVLCYEAHGVEKHQNSQAWTSMGTCHQNFQWRVGGTTYLTLLVQYGLLCFMCCVQCQGPPYFATFFATFEEHML